VLAQHRRPPAPCWAYLKLRLQGGFRQRAGWRERRAGRARGAFAGASWRRYADGAIVSTCMRGASWPRYADGEGRDGMAQDAGEGCVGARTRVHHAFPPYHVERPAAGSPVKLVISRVCSTARAQQTHLWGGGRRRGEHLHAAQLELNRLTKGTPQCAARGA